MTLDTRAHIYGPVDPEALFLHLLDVLSSKPGWQPSWVVNDPTDPWRTSPGPLANDRGATYEHNRKGDQIYQKQTNKPLWIQGDSEYQSTLCQGLPAILEVTYATDGPLHLCTPDPKLDEPDEDYTGPDYEPHLVAVSFDTAYGYRDTTGGGCSDLHAFLLDEICRYLEDLPNPPRWLWHDECRGTWHEPSETYRLGDASRCELAQYVRQGGQP